MWLNKKQIRFTPILIIILTFCVVSCNTKNDTSKIEIAKRYYSTLNSSNDSVIHTWFGDSLITKEGGYVQQYSQNEFKAFLKWDAVFDPSYQILNIEIQDTIVKTKISKLDKRILFLHEKPFITNQIIRFKEDKISSIETIYLNFDEKTWENNKTKLLSWIDKNHPELNGFIYDQTETGGIKFLKAIELYNTNK